MSRTKTTLPSTTQFVIKPSVLAVL